MRSPWRSVAVLAAVSWMLLAAPPAAAVAAATSSRQPPAASTAGVETTTVEQDDATGSGLSPAAWFPGLLLAAGWVVLVGLQLRRGRHLRRVTASGPVDGDAP